MFSFDLGTSQAFADICGDVSLHVWPSLWVARRGGARQSLALCPAFPQLSQAGGHASV
ncbi:hypothetical protein Tco_1189767, partial [Tanacetum coccineum]